MAQELQAEADARRAEALALQLASAARLTERDPLVAQPAHPSADRGLASHQNGPVPSAAGPAAGREPQLPPRRDGRGFAASAQRWQDPVVQPAGPAVSSSQSQHAVGPPAPYGQLSMAAFLPPEVQQQQQPVPAIQPPRSQPPAFAPPQPPQQSSSPGPGWGTAGIAAAPTTGLSNGHGYSGSGGPFGGGLFGLSGGAFTARQPQADPSPAASSSAAAGPALYTPFGGVGSAFGAVTLPPRMPDHGLMPPPVPLQTAFGALPGSVDLQSLWQPGAVLTDGGDQSSQCV